MSTAIQTAPSFGGKAFDNVDGAGVLVRRKGHTLVAAAEEVAKTYHGKNGRVIFTCPNYAVVHFPGRAEVTVWAQ